jgi:hypothetical protein
MAHTQEQLNQLYIGSWWNLAERYTGALTSVFVSLFYSAIMPTNLAITTCSLGISYWVDKYVRPCISNSDHALAVVRVETDETEKRR